VRLSDDGRGRVYGFNRLSEKKRVLGLEDLNKFRLSEKKRVLGLEGLKKKID
jgi:hypothetical protein